MISDQREKLITVLIVDDSGTIRGQLRNFLQESGCKVIAEAKNGIEAIDQYVRNKPEIVTLDLVMPVLDGLSALSEIRRYDPKAKVMVITSSLSKKNRSEAEELGVEIFVEKPISLEKIQQALSEIQRFKKGIKYG
jgi:two-component system chemotaxis response regulator CheY